MGRCFIQLVTGPAGSGKSTYCTAIQQHCSTLGPLRKRNVHVANLDPAAENFSYDVSFDIRDLITVEDVMEELGLGPNGALIYCMEYLLQNMDWLEEEIGKFDDDEYLILDCPGQIELYTHAPIIKKVIDQMVNWGHASRMCSVFIVDATFVCDAPKFISGSLLSLSAMIALELPHVNVLSKTDLVDEAQVESILDVESASVLWQREEYQRVVEDEKMMNMIKLEREQQQQQQEAEKKWQPWDQIVTTKNIPKHILQALDMTQLGHLFLINNTLGGDLLLYKFNKDQALAWLQRKMDRISAFLGQQLVRSQDDAWNVSPQTSYHHNQQRDEATGAFCSSFCMLPSRENLDTANNVETKQTMMMEQHSKPVQVSPETEQQHGNHDADDDIHIVSSKDKLLIKRSAAQILCEYLPPYWQREFLNSQGGMTLDDLIMATKPKNRNSINTKKDTEETTTFDSTVSKSSSSCIQFATIHGMSEIDKLHQYTIGNVDGTGNGEGSSTSMLSKKRKEAEQSAGLKKLSKVNKKGMKTMTSFFNAVGKPKK
mmetsp:Transcript_6517/g.12285  ORF Transcript_6517/g.12285 Transcript_6517/m.12285 type:complete len:543 (+) Transcript_6517:2023-3651(+)